MNTTANRAEAAAADLLVDYLTGDELESLDPARLLGVVGFTRLPPFEPHEIPTGATMTPALGGADLYEVFRVASADQSLVSGRRGRIRYRHGEDLLFGCLTLDERDLHAPPAALGEALALQRVTQVAYREIFDLLAEGRYPHLLRIWNYLPEINRLIDGEERYRIFNAARQTAFRESGRATAGAVPAACALGSPAGSPLSVYFLAAPHVPRPVENPRQTSAYHYPAKFGRHSPTFSRACIGAGRGSNLFISGTASIVGYETMHVGNVVAQTKETLANIGALIDEANRSLGWSRYSLDALKMKVYVRHATDLDAIRGVLGGALRAAKPLYLSADICREDLLVEIEATG
jgi:enamine deaminase RidA (YjgF/YER057c/UK114 family)